MRTMTRQVLLGLVAVLLLSLLPAVPLQAATVGAPAPLGTPLPPLPVPIPAPPVPQDRGPVLALHVTLAPTQIRVGAAALVSVSVTNGATDAATKLVLAMPVPPGVVALPGTATVGADQGWRWDLGTLPPGASATVTGTLEVTRMLPGGALSLAVTATAAELTSAVRSDGGAILDDPAAEVALAPVTPGRAATLRSADGRVTVTFPAQAATAALQLRYARPLRTVGGLTLPTLPPVTTPLPAAPQARATIAAITDTLPVRDPYGRTGLGSFVLQAATSQGAAVSRFTAPLTISVRYTPEQLAALHLAEEDLTLFWFDEQANTWQPLPTTIDAKTGTASATVDHFTAFELSDGSAPSTLYVPSLAGWQTDRFTGAASYQLPIEVPAGPNGIKPQLQLSYNSNADWGRVKKQAGYMGRDWSLHPGYIARNTSVDDDQHSFALVLGGRSYTIVRGNALPGFVPSPTQLDGWDWRPTDETYIRVRAYANGTIDGRARVRWVIWTKDGTRYEFAQDNWWGPPGNSPPTEAYRWNLSLLTDTHTNTVVYSYDRDTISTGDGSVHPTSWPTTITWANNRYRIEFGHGLRGTGAGSAAWDMEWEGGNSANIWRGNYNGAPHESRQLNTLKVLSNPSGSAWELVRQYTFGYDYSLLSDATTSCGSNRCPDTGYKKLTLKRITQVGKDNTALPTTSFTYQPYVAGPLPNAGWNRLTSVTNGQGGTATFSYAYLPQVYAGQSNAGDFKNRHRVTSKTLTNGQGQSYTWSYAYGLPQVNTLGAALGSVGITLTSAALYLNEHMGSPASPELATRPRSEFRGHAWTTETDPEGNQTQSWFYQGDAPCGYPKDQYGARLKSTSITTFNDNACFRELRDREHFLGRAYKTEVRGPVRQGSPLLHTTERTFAIDETTVNYTQYPKRGLWRAFGYEQQTVSTAWEGGSTPSSHTTVYTYGESIQRGNLTAIAEHDQNNALVRTTVRFYGANITEGSTGTYLVGRLTDESVKDGNGNLLASKNLFYDTSSFGNVGSVGDMRRSIQFFNVPAAPNAIGMQLLGTDTTYGYDAYGNPTTVTTYAAPGWKNVTADSATTTFSAPGNGSAARTTTTTYDAAFHTFPIEILNPLGQRELADYDYRMGTLIKVVGPNAIGSGIDCRSSTVSIAATLEVSCATYDPFGRIRKLIRPGDSVVAPTKELIYFDATVPTTYTVMEAEQPGNLSARRPSVFAYDGLGNLIQRKVEMQDGAQTTVTDMRYNGQGQVVQQSQPRYVAETPSTTFWTYSPPPTPLYNLTATTYDALGRVRFVTDPAGLYSQQRYEVSSGSKLRVANTIDRNQHRTQQRADALGRLVAVGDLTGNCGTYWGYTCGGAFTTPWAAAGTTSYTYNGLDLLKTVTDAQNNVTSISYDSLGRKTAMSDPDMGDWQYGYNANGRLQSQRDGRGQTTWFDYDVLERMTTTRADGANGTAYAWQRYDEAGISNGIGRLTTTHSDAAIITQRFDGRGRVVQNDTYMPWVGNVTMFWSYDSADRVTTMQYPTLSGGAETVTYTYDQGWRPKTLCSSLGGCIINDAVYTALNQPDGIATGNGLTTDYQYSGPLQRLSSLTVGSVLRRSYQYDPGGNVASISDPWLAGGGQTQTFGYDAQDRLTSAATSGSSVAAYNETYSYDQIGNVTSKAGVSYDSAPSSMNGNGPHAPRIVGGQAYTYDGNGNLTSGNGRSLSWTRENMVRTVTQGGVTETYFYDTDGTRVGQQRGDVQTVTLFGGLWEVVVGGARKSFYRFGGQVVAVRDSGQGLSYLHGDHLGSVSVETDGSGAVVGRQEYDPWGKQRGTDLLTRTTRTFTGQQQDATGLLNYNARMYDPALGRFISADTIVPGGKQQALTPLTVAFHEPGFVGEVNAETAWTQGKGFAFQLSSRDRQQAKNAQGPANPQALNRYSYTLNNPVRYTDPSGHTLYMTKQEAEDAVTFIRRSARDNNFASQMVAVFIEGGGTGVILWMEKYHPDMLTKLRLNPGLAIAIITLVAITIAALGAFQNQQLEKLADGIEDVNKLSSKGIALMFAQDLFGSSFLILNRTTGDITSVGVSNYWGFYVPDEYLAGRIVGNPCNSGFVFTSDGITC